jgi:hypothetical protein
LDGVDDNIGDVLRSRRRRRRRQLAERMDMKAEERRRELTV